MRIIVSIFIFVYVAFAQDSIYFLPKDSKEFKNHLTNLIDNSKSNIDIAMYNFDHKQLAKQLKKSVKNGVEVNVIFDEKKVKTEKKIKYEFLKENGVKTYIANKKMHLKLALFDNNTAVFGSMNWTKDSFEDNYEIVYITDNETVVNKSKKIFKELKEK